MDSTVLLICNRVFLFKNSLQSCSHCSCMALRSSVAPRALQASATNSVSVPDHMKSKNLYEVLEISPAATAKDRKRAYRKLARDVHPDHAASPREKNESTQMFLRIHNAYATLSDPCDRAQYGRQILGQMRLPVVQLYSQCGTRPTGGRLLMDIHVIVGVKEGVGKRISAGNFGCNEDSFG